MNKKEMIRAVSRRTKLPAAVVDDVVEALIDIVTLNLAVGQEVAFRGFGKLEPRDRGPKTLKHPGTGDVLELQSYRTVVFLPSDVLKERLNSPPR